MVTERMVLRRYRPGDAVPLKQAIDSSLEHLRAFMDWSWAAPEPLQVVEDRVRASGEAFTSDGDFVYGAFSPDESELVGSAGLHRRLGLDALEIGYWIRASRVRQGLATEASAALTHVAFACCRVDRVEIRIDPANVASLGVPGKLGYALDRVVPGELAPIRVGGPRRDAAVFVLHAADFATSAAGATPRPAW